MSVTAYDGGLGAPSMLMLRCGAYGSSMVCSLGTGRTGKKYFYCWCNKKHRTLGTECRTCDVSVKVVEKFVLGQLRAYAIDKRAIQQAVQEANSERDENLARLDADLAQCRIAHGKSKQAVKSLLDFIEAGGTEVSSLLTRIKEAEAREQALKREILELGMKRHALESQLISTTIVAEGYRNLHHLLD